MYNQYYDIEDIHNPIKTFSNNKIYFKASSIETSNSHIDVTRNYYRTNSWFSLFGSNQYSYFYSLEEQRHDNSVSNILFSFLFFQEIHSKIMNYYILLIVCTKKTIFKIMAIDLRLK